nr:FAD-dependent monooxygenase [Kibdelosporangium sp. MJ126-NF4]CEL22488.1 Polyketide hydroxylase WhiE VIII [Kibdelosporangium sp. MJ126-NF4]CTQ89344.1 Polyketide hydroxylase WhiE VIII [Kibdelosporangium sp. MJ126-NF4]
MKQAHTEVPVLVVGATVAGLSAAAFLGQHGVPALVVDPLPRRPRSPRNHRLTTRTMEALHGAGFADPVLAVAQDESAPRTMATVETLVGPVLSLLSPPWPTVPESVSPMRPCYCNDGELSDVLCSVAGKLGAEIRMSTSLVRYSKDAEGITAVLREPAGAEHTVRSGFLLLAAGSPDGTAADIGVHGPGTLGHHLSIAFRADLDAVSPSAGGYLVRAVGGMVLPEPGRHRWALVLPCEPTRLVELTDERCVELIDTAIGRSDVDVTIIGRTSFDITACIADRFNDGRLVLLGDAACVAPPMPGMNGNTHIQEAHNISWKIAAILRGAAGLGLLDSYDAERRPRAEASINDAMSLLSAPGTVAAADSEVPDRLTYELGFRYHSTAVLAESDGGAVFEDPLVPTGRPGTRAAHVRLTTGESTLDSFGSGFVMLAGPNAVPSLPAVLPRAGGRTIEIRELPSESLWRYGISANGLVLVRPDGIVAWRAERADRESWQLLPDVLAQLHSRHGDAR